MTAAGKKFSDFFPGFLKAVAGFSETETQE